MGCPSECNIGDNLTFSICTHDPDTGVLTDADAAPPYRVYEDETDPPILTGNMAKLDDDDTTGFYTELIACTVANGFEDGKTYTIYIEATVDTDKGGICYSFKAVADDTKVLDTTIASVDTPDTVFRLTDGLTGNDDINNAVCSIYDTTGTIWSGPRRVTDYVHATKQVTIDADTAFPLAAGDRVVIWNMSYATTAAPGAVGPGDIADIADAVWDEDQEDHITDGSTGLKQKNSDRHYRP